MDEITEEFLIESREALDQLDSDLVQLESSASDAEVLARIFRALHTVKGTCGFLGFQKLERVAHAGEGLLSQLRDGAIAVSPEIATCLLSTVDAIRSMLDAIQITEQDGDEGYASLIETLRTLAEPPAVQAPPPQASEAVRKRRAKRTKQVQPKAGQLLSLRVPSIAVTKQDSLLPVVPTRLTQAVAAVDNGPQHATQGDTVRVDVHLLDRLMDLAGELVLTRNQVRDIQTGVESPALAAASQRLNLVTAGLQEGIILMRMQPVDHLFGKFPRVVRDTARQCGKLARAELDGKHAELDRTLLEAIKDPLTHLIRNAVDHGIELPAERIARGKPSEGVVLVRAVHQSGHVSIEIADDGAGIPLDKVRAKAVARGLITEDRAQRMTDAEATNLIFLPGLSTATAVTNVSGRGVGMDVVKTNVERLGGTVEVESKLGVGTVFRLKLPLTLAIIPALIVEVGGDRYAIPQVHLQELVLLDHGKQRLETVYDAPVLRLRDRLLPIVFFSECIGKATRAECLARPKAHIAVLQVNGLSFGLAVDRVVDQQEVVVKPLASQIESINIFSACTILGDGRVVLILDVGGIAQRAGITRGDRSDGAATPGRAADGQASSLDSFLLVAEPGNVRVALPLERVTRIETVPRTRLERAGATPVLQYESEIVPLLFLSEQLPATLHPEPVEPSDYLNVVVVASSGGSVGIVVHDVMDVCELAASSRYEVSDTGVVASVVVHERVTDILSVDWLIERSGLSAARLLRSA